MREVQTVLRRATPLRCFIHGQLVRTAVSEVPAAAAATAVATAVVVALVAVVVVVAAVAAGLVAARGRGRGRGCSGCGEVARPRPQWLRRGLR